MMTRKRTLILTGVSAGLYLFLCWAFADGLFSGNWWHSDAIAGSNVFTYIFLLSIIAAGLYQAVNAPAEPQPATTQKADAGSGQFDDPKTWKQLTGSVYWALIWMPVRFFVGREWLTAGEEKLRSDGWMGGGTALRGYWTNATKVPETGRPAITYGWFRQFLQYMLDHQWYTWFAKVIACGETLVGIGLIVGALVGIAAFFGTVLNFNFQLAGSASSNPVLFGLGVLLVIAWKVAGYWGLDRALLPLLGTPWTRERGAIGRVETKIGIPTQRVHPA
jgi:thiosulfate dehydrogenase [quinone] large subunit